MDMRTIYVHRKAFKAEIFEPNRELIDEGYPKIRTGNCTRLCHKSSKINALINGRQMRRLRVANADVNEVANGDQDEHWAWDDEKLPSDRSGSSK